MRNKSYRQNKIQPLGEVLKEYIKVFKLERKLKETKLISEWESLLGKTVAKATTNIFIHKKLMYVYLNSSVIRNELLMLKDSIIKTINDRAGEEIIINIVFS